MAHLLRHSGKLKDKFEFAELLRTEGLTNIAVEVGVWRGDFSAPFLERWGGKRMFLVDAWAKIPGYVDTRNDQFDPTDYDFVVSRFAHTNAILMKMMSEQAAEQFDDESIDFVYIDADHSYEAATKDINLWWPKVKPNGILAGHDMLSTSHLGVTSAVMEFCNRTNLTVDVVDGVEAYSWYIIKPKP